MATTEEKLVAEFPGVKFNKQRGFLLLTSLRVAWAPDVAEKFQTDHLYETIKGEASSQIATSVYLAVMILLVVCVCVCASSESERRN